MSGFLRRFKQYTSKDVVIILVLTLLYFVAGKLGLRLAFFNPSATPIWAPTGIAIAALLLLGSQYWPAIFIGAFFVNLTTAGTVITSLGIALGNTLEGVVGAFLVRRFMNKETLFSKPSDVFIYTILAGVLATAVSATFGVDTLFIAGLVHFSDYFQVWLTWWLGDMGGALLVAPLIILWVRDHRFSRSTPHIIETLCVFILFLIVNQFVFGALNTGIFLNYPLAFLTIPVLVWIAFRFGPRETSTALLILYVMAAFGTLHGRGPFVRDDLNQSLLILQMFMGIMFLGKMPLATASFQLKKSENQYRKLIETSPDAILVTDLQGNIRVIDKQTMELYGFTNQSEVIGKSGFDFIAKEDVERLQESLQQVLREGKVTNVEYVSIKKDGTRFDASANASLLLDAYDKPEGIMVVARDVTKKKEVEKAKSEFFALAAHQLRAPLSAMNWNIELLLSHKAKIRIAAPIKKKLESIYSSTQELIALVNNFLNISRIEQGAMKNEPVKTDVIQLIQSVVDQMQSVADKQSVKIIFGKEGTVENVLIDPKLFRETVLNLVSNAIKFNTEKGKVRISIAQVNGNILLTVADTGMGIPLEEQDKVFQKFYRTARAKKLGQEGTGLGLFMIKSYMENAGGKIWFKSPTQGDHGTTFYVQIPIKKEL